MKTALDLPDELAREIKVRAAQQGRKLKDEIAGLLRLGLDAAGKPTIRTASPLVVDAVTGLPMVACCHAARTADRLTPNRIAKILLDQEVAWNDEAGR